ncbi:LegC family aminotransferase [Prochlorococcus marinus]|uniref:Predicted pyridoxal phosphate-dependent enzyme n=1 Tax=Prochlorococcus marinus (strain MIT 9211) TaxID=93059 RepID=A9BBG0_PROM4|nr:LegC family aminotransferase [Prochlorococcus marinus]ABX09172.1 Predicted pyridoxal phosphate-dependent enzyme [Prochlorococcus marinus str. MIT 9211]
MSDLLIADEILDSIKKVTGVPSDSTFIGLHEPLFKETNAYKYVKESLDSGWVSSSGEWVERFENAIKNYTNSNHCIAVNNGTVALRLALHLAGVKPGEEVILPPLSFVATANAISHLGGVPHFVDIERENLGLCPVALRVRLNNICEEKNGSLINKETGRKIAAVVPVHVFGTPAKILSLKKVCDDFNLPMIEDAAEALGSFKKIEHQWLHCGLIGEIGILSFNGNKIITTGGGGALLTNNAELAVKARHLSTTAKLKHKWDFNHDEVGWNDRLPGINAAIGVAQLEELSSRIEMKRVLFQKYLKELGSLENTQILKEPHNCKSNHWLITLRLCMKDTIEINQVRNELLTKSHELGIQLRPSWKPIHMLPMYRDMPKGELINIENEFNRLINLPSSPQILSKKIMKN